LSIDNNLLLKSYTNLNKNHITLILSTDLTFVYEVIYPASESIRILWLFILVLFVRNRCLYECKLFDLCYLVMVFS
jgi:hypothetical protein